MIANDRLAIMQAFAAGDLSWREACTHLDLSDYTELRDLLAENKIAVILPLREDRVFRLLVQITGTLAEN